jgi:steroid delta-isomerase-like uncharacterized protein
MKSSSESPNAVTVGAPGFLEGFGAAWSSANEGQLAAYFADDVRYVEGAMGVTYSGIAELARFFRYVLAFSSDSHIEFTSLISDSAAFAAEWRWSGTADGPLQLGGKTYEPTGRRFDVPGVAICRTRDDGLIVYHKDYYDVATLVRQIGLRLG